MTEVSAQIAGTPPYDQSLHLDAASTKDLSILCGQFDSHLQQIESRLNVKIQHRGSHFLVYGNEDKDTIHAAIHILQSLYAELSQGFETSPESVHLAIRQFFNIDEDVQADAKVGARALSIQTKKMAVKPRGKNQQNYVQAIMSHDISFGIGPAGTGKTYLAVACATQALMKGETERILLVRPAVEAGEKLGFLPGDLSQKVDPYLRPLYDALYEMLGVETVDKLIERNVIEIAPLAYMRGRTLNNAFVIMDESQNTTREQMKMFLTRIGFGTSAVINGDPSQVDLPRGQPSGLEHSAAVLEGVRGISFTRFSSRDVVRHPLVRLIVEAYDKFADG
ncbi:MAG: phosphate starvation-inducible PhoH-like protein [Cellvibrionaceae bacterium]